MWRHAHRWTSASHKSSGLKCFCFLLKCFGFLNTGYCAGFSNPTRLIHKTIACYARVSTNASSSAMFCLKLLNRAHRMVPMSRLMNHSSSQCFRECCIISDLPNRGDLAPIVSVVAPHSRNGITVDHELSSAENCVTIKIQTHEQQKILLRTIVLLKVVARIN